VPAVGLYDIPKADKYVTKGARTSYRWKDWTGNDGKTFRAVYWAFRWCSVFEAN
jgi:hypothetical protein